VDVLVNGAGVGVFGSLLDCSVERFDEVCAVNLRAPFLLCRELVPGMVKARRGDIVMIASLAGRNPVADGAVYAMSKHGLAGLSESAMLELRAHGIRVMTVCPGSVDTPFFDRAGHKPPPRAYILSPADVADAVVHALEQPRRANISEIHVRPTNPRGPV
jgi:short-subunit dehydrogenase